MHCLVFTLITANSHAETVHVEHSANNVNNVKEAHFTPAGSNCSRRQVYYVI